MKKFPLKTLIATSFIAFTTVSYASALESKAFYVKPIIGYSMGNIDLVIKDDKNISTADKKEAELKGRAKNAKGLRAGIGFGYNISENFRTELTFTADNIESKYKKNTSENKSTEITDLQTQGDSKIQSYNFMMSGYYHFMPSCKVSPYFGAGVGFNSSDYTLKQSKDVNQSRDQNDNMIVKTEKAKKFIYKAALGMDVELSKNIVFDLSYAIGNIGESLSKKGVIQNMPKSVVSTKAKLVHGIEAGVRFHF